MSTIFFGLDELANVGAYVASEPLFSRRVVAELLACFSRANLSAFEARYPRERGAERACSATELHDAIERVRVADGPRACATAGLLRYNLDDCDDVDTLDATHTIVNAALRVTAERLASVTPKPKASPAAVPVPVQAAAQPAQRPTSASASPWPSFGPNLVPIARLDASGRVEARVSVPSVPVRTAKPTNVARETCDMCGEKHTDGVPCPYKPEPAPTPTSTTSAPKAPKGGRRYSGPRRMTAKYHGACVECGEHIEPGDSIEFTPRKGTCCAGCAREVA